MNGPVVNYALLNTLYPPGVLQRNTGDVYLDTADRRQPYTQQTSVGFQRQLGAQVSASADYVHTIARDQWLLENLNPGLRINTTASGAINRVDPSFVTNVWQRQNIGEYTYDALNVVFEKRDSHNWSGRVSYTLANSRGNNSAALTSTNNYQVLDNPNLDLGQGPTDFDRRHNLVVSGRIVEVPRTHGMTLSGTLRMLSGLPFSLIDSSSDPDRNGILAGSAARRHLLRQRAECRHGRQRRRPQRRLRPGIRTARHADRLAPEAGRPRRRAHARSDRRSDQRHQPRQLRQPGDDRKRERPPQHQFPAVDDAVRRWTAAAAAGRSATRLKSYLTKLKSEVSKGAHLRLQT